MPLFNQTPVHGSAAKILQIMEHEEVRGTPEAPVTVKVILGIDSDGNMWRKDSTTAVWVAIPGKRQTDLATV